MHILGLQGMSRRIQTYSSGQGFDLWNLVATIGAFMIAIATAMFIWNVISSRKAFKAGETQAPGPDPWDARSLEWMTASPVPEHNFDETIHVENKTNSGTVNGAKTKLDKLSEEPQPKRSLTMEATLMCTFLLLPIGH